MPQIRKATESDFDTLVELYLNEVEQDSDNAKVFASDLLTRMRTILALEDQELCGTASWEIRGGLDDGVGELVAIGVNEAFQRQGFAKLLIEGIISDARKMFEESNSKLRILYLFMEKGNESARLFYESIGFKDVAAIPTFYPHDSASVLVRYF
ncbi:MAG: N-acetyltransferase family protein [Candidatus Thorarchaeota archaeon]|jgi:ribosomal protein S18 acetylase RimI-like enzyme